MPFPVITDEYYDFEIERQLRALIGNEDLRLVDVLHGEHGPELWVHGPPEGVERVRERCAAVGIGFRQESE